jgi:FAD/FMN-containing dehydrogenase
VFATQHNIRVVVKSTGHDYQGRSTAAGALAIWLHNMNDVEVVEAFVACPGDKPRPAVTVQPGAGYGDVYDLLTAGGKYAVVGGSARTVSSAGGHVLGGGHSFMSPTFGLGK